MTRLPLALVLACAGAPDRSSDESSDATGALDLEVVFTETPADGLQDPGAWFAFAAPDAASYICRLDDGAPFGCDGAAFVVPMAEGAHTLGVTAAGADGQLGPEAVHTWTIASIFAPDPNAELVPTTMIPAAVDPVSWRGIFRINCDFAHSSYDDPIVSPGLAGAAHLHRFYGNKAVDAATTFESLYAMPESSCQGNTLNGSSYWVPALLAPSYDEITGARLLDAYGDPAWEVVPAVVGSDEEAHEVFYYSAAVDDLDSIQNVPPGLRMIAGDSGTTPTGPAQDTAIVRWHCQTWEAADGTNPNFSTTIPECAEPDRVRMDIFFPSCWNGVDLDSADHKSHMAYPVNDGGPNGTHCPDSHPVPILRPSYHYAFPVLPGNSDPATQTSRGWRLASDHYTVSLDSPGGLSLHGDWFNAWHPQALQAVLDGCVKAALDCHDGNLANGYRLSGTSPGTWEEPAIVNEGLGL